MTSSRLNAKARAYMREHPEVNYTEALSIVSGDKTPFLSTVLSDLLNSLVTGETPPSLKTTLHDIGLSVPADQEEAYPISPRNINTGDIVKAGKRSGIVLDSESALFDGKVVKLTELGMVEFYRLPSLPNPSPERDPFLAALNIDPDTYDPREEWERNKGKPIVVPLGESYGVFGKDIPTPKGAVHEVDFDKTPHIGIIGGTGTGKSVLIRTLINGIAAKYSSDDVEIRVHTKSSEVYNLPQVTTFSGLGAYEGIMSGVRAEMERRREEINRKKSSEDIPRFKKLLVIFEESPVQLAQYTVTDARSACEEELARIASLGRELGIHLVLAVQAERHMPAKARCNLGAIYRMDTPHRLAQIMKITSYPYGTEHTRSARGFAVCDRAAWADDGEIVHEAVQVFKAFGEFGDKRDPDVLKVFKRISDLRKTPSWMEALHAPRCKTDLSFPLGVDEDKNIVEVDLGCATRKSLVILGDDGSGKSSTVREAVLSLSYRYGPEHVRFVVLGESFPDLKQLPHTYSTGENVNVALNALDQELSRRYAIKGSPSFSATEDTPHIVVVCDADTVDMGKYEEMRTLRRLLDGLFYGMYVVYVTSTENSITESAEYRVFNLYGKKTPGHGWLRRSEWAWELHGVQVFVPTWVPEEGLKDAVYVPDTVFGRILDSISG